MTKDEALIKIKKCMALSKSAEAHEAAAALRQAQKLMDMFSLSETDISLADVSEEKARAASAGFAGWESRLARIVAEAFGCENYVSRDYKLTGYGELKTTTHYVFVGIDAAPALAAYAFDVLSRQCARARAAHIKKQPKNCKATTKTARGDEFAKGWVLSAASAVERFAQPVRNAELLLEYMGRKHPNLQTITPKNTAKGKKVDGHAHAGFVAGRSATLNNGVGSREQTLLGG